jgi:hypothetical protein
MATAFVAALVIAIPAAAFIGGMATVGLGLGAAIGSVVGAAGVVTVAGMAIGIAETNIEEIYTGINPMRDILLGENQELYDGVQGTVAFLGYSIITYSAYNPAPRNSQEQANVGTSEGKSNTVQSLGNKTESYVAKRGWTWDSMNEVVGNSYTTREALNKAYDNAATAYYNQVGDYVVLDNVTGELVQLSKFGDTGWIPDSTIINPYKP